MLFKNYRVNRHVRARALELLNCGELHRVYTCLELQRGVNSEMVSLIKLKLKHLQRMYVRQSDMPNDLEDCYSFICAYHPPCEHRKLREYERKSWLKYIIENINKVKI
ncbi:hypothetical protein vBValMR10Z_385 [Vibrio phage vB_ValM_R10Z]|nr:hypothetical protein vBValMR10Z_385 [Vibrio phage vB_ValM_R10Z]